MSRVIASRISKRTVWAARRAGAPLREGVEAVLEDVEVEGGEIHGAVVVQPVEDEVELVLPVGLEAALR